MSSRLDYIFITPFLFTLASSCVLGIHYLSDHSSVAVRFPSEVPVPGVRKWRLPAGMLESEGNCEGMRSQIIHFLEDNQANDASASVRWEALKCTLRGWIIRYSSQIRHQERLQTQTLTPQIRAKET